MITVIHRPGRITEALVPPEPEELSPPPQLPEGSSGGLPLQSLLPVLGAVSSVVMMIVLRGTNPVFMVVAALVFVVAIVSGLGLAFTHRAQAARTRRTQRERYLDYLEELRSTMRERSAQMRRDALVLDPAPASLPLLVTDPSRVWERRRSHADFLRVRVGLGDVPWFRLAAPAASNPLQPSDPLMAEELSLFAARAATVPGMPVTVPLDRAGDVALVGPRDEVLGVARAMAAQLAAFHAPDDVQLAAVFAGDRADDWAGLDLLPHLVMGRTFDGPIRARRVAPDLPTLAQVLADELAERVAAAEQRRRSMVPAGRAEQPRLVVFLDEHGGLAQSFPFLEGRAGLEELGITLVHLVEDRLDEPSEVSLRVTVSDGALTVTDARVAGDARGASNVRGAGDARGVGDAAPVADLRGSIDAMSAPLLTAVARLVAPLRLSLDAAERADAGEPISMPELLGIEDPAALEAAEAWGARAPRDFLRVPIGVDRHGMPIHLDLKESAQLGMGPHGICIGATGSGKSELLRTLVLALAASHSPDDLSMILVDYKGGAAFAPFARLGHVAGLMDNLQDDPQLTRRARESIAGEVLRRQKLLRDAGASPSITHYRELRRTRPELPPMPHLLLVIDEFGELLTAEPDFVDLLLTIGRIGRSIGVHLLLSSQRIESGKLRGLDTYLSYRIGLRTFSEAESQTILGTADAFHLPAVPGFGFLKVDTSIYTEFRAGYVSGPVDAPAPGPTADDAARDVFVLPAHNGVGADGGAGVGSADAGEPEAQLVRPDTGPSLVDVAVGRLAASGRQTAPVWLPPLPTRVALGSVVDAATAAADGGLRTPIGLLDDPSRQRQAPWLLDFTIGGGHIAVVGAPGSGRTTVLRTIAASLALTRTPREVSVYGMDLAGGGLSRIEGFPHVGGVATRSDRTKLLRLIEELQAMIRHRETVFRDHDIDSIAMLRARHAAGEVPELVSPDIVLLVDGFGAIRTEFEELEDPFTELVQRGGSFGIHVIVALTRWNELRMASQPLIGQRFELRLNDPSDSNVSRAAAAVLLSAEPGRVLAGASLYGQVALPVLDDVDDAQLGDALEALAARLTADWSGPAAAPIRLLPESFEPSELPDALEVSERVPFGLRQDTMEYVAFDPLLDQHLIVFGDAGSGKTTLLRGIAAGLIDRSSPDELAIAVMDVRGGTAAEIPEDYLGGHATNGRDARGLAEAIAAELEKRSSATHEGSRPRIVVLVDDFDILASSGTEPLSPLLPYLPSARDLGLNVVVTRPVGGASRALYDLSLQSLRDGGGTGFVMSGERSEGQIFPRVYAEQFPPGRGRLVRRGAPPRVVQVANFASTRGAVHAP
ncbi:type VII secretion protein EccCa [Sinomonas sp. P47F7]|uniref:type VII secretion protein EccCa n=1 Tax=Sinomonas sp. P47F7 TaxID=3410987 RepID=UPI003BF51060